MSNKPEIELSVSPSDSVSEGEQWVLDGGVSVSRRFNFTKIERRPSKLFPRDVSADATNNRKPL
jgi:hypothetical protein